VKRRVAFCEPRGRFKVLGKGETLGEFFRGRRWAFFFSRECAVSNCFADFKVGPGGHNRGAWACVSDPPWLGFLLSVGGLGAGRRTSGPKGCGDGTQAGGPRRGKKGSFLQNRWCSLIEVGRVGPLGFPRGLGGLCGFALEV